MRAKRFSIAVIILGLTFSLAQPSLADIDWERQRVLATGEGSIESEAREVCRKNLYDLLLTVVIDSENRLADLVGKNPGIKKSLVQFVKSQEPEEAPFPPPGKVVFEIEIPLYGEGSLSDFMDNHEKWLSGKEPAEEHTSLIVDTKGLRLFPGSFYSLSAGKGGAIYRGDYAYARSRKRAERLKRAGANPLVVKAQAVRGETIELESEGGRQIREAGFNNEVFPAGKVILLID